MDATAPTFTLCDLFTSIQGEGGQVGRPFIFLRFWGCPLTCPWCDEPRHRNPEFCRTLSLSDTLHALEIQTPGLNNILLTGGEPLAQHHLPTLVTHLKGRGKWIAMETSGLGGPVPDDIDWITLSPKTPLPDFPIQRASEVKFILGDEAQPQQEALMEWWLARHPNVWVQPRWQGSCFPTQAAHHCRTRVLASGGRLRLSLQMHKWLGIP
ncbi:MAG: 7-carboxy-7-deazaguanine synthase QueE [Magnetococcales bacterium]|nr:7-carboxy-7-deazaguanine synthase QueE [Magnetococcales bacterium]